MSLIQLGTPFLGGGIRSIHFFNGRLLSGEDLSQEQAANLLHLRQLGRAIGDGIAYGLEVSETPLISTPAAPVVTVQGGLAINRLGQALALQDAVNVSILPGGGSSGTNNGDAFAVCGPVETGLYTAGAGLYLLTIAPAQGGEGRAPVNGLGNSTAACNTRYEVEGVQFRALALTSYFTAELQEPALLRNRVAHRCLGTADANLQAAISNPFGPPPPGYGLLDELRATCLTDAEVPLAVLYWTTDGVQFIDLWAVRRRIVPPAAAGGWLQSAGERRLAEAEACIAQFQQQITDLRSDPQENLGIIRLVDRFRYLPPVGMIPITEGSVLAGFHPDLFFDTITLRSPADTSADTPADRSIHIEGARVAAILHAGLRYPPLDVTEGVLVWVYRVRENKQAAGRLSPITQPYLLFSSGHMPFMGDPHFDVNRWDFSNAV